MDHPLRPIGLGLLLTLSVAGAAAQGEDNDQLRSSGVFDMWDRDGDGRLSVEEVGDRQLFRRWDSDSDNQLSRQEFFDGLDSVRREADVEEGALHDG